MPWVKGTEKARAKYVTVKEFAEQYSISKPQVYRILRMPEMQEAIIKVGEKAIRINLDEAFEVMTQVFR